MRFARIAVLILITALGACGGPQARKAAYLAKGREYLAAHDYTKARLEFRNALQVDPNDAEASFLAGQASERLGNVREAAQMFQTAIDSDKNHLGARAQLARIYAFGGAPGKALELVEPGLVLAPQDPELLTSRAAARQQQGDKAGARSDAEAAVRVAPTNEAAVALLAGLYKQDGEIPKAIDLVGKAVAAPGASTDLRRVLAQLYFDANRHADAIRELERNITAEPENLAHRFELADLLLLDKNVDGAEAALRAAVASAPASADAKLALANVLATHRSYEAAETELKRMAASAPKDMQLRLGLGQFYASRNKVPEAEAVYREIIKDDDTNPSGLVARDRLVTVYLGGNRLAAATPLIDEVLKKNPRDSDALFARASVSLARGNTDAAVADLRAVQRDQPNAIAVQRAIARAYELNDDPTLAEETLRAAVQASPANVELRLDLAQFLSRRGRADQALPILEKLAVEHPGDLTFLGALFDVELARKDFAGARRTAALAVAARPDLPTGNYMMGLAELANGKRDAARAAFGRAIAATPDAVQPIDALVRLDLTDHHPDQAIARIDKLIAQFPANPLLWNFKGGVLASLKRTDEAIASFREAIRLKPTWPEPYGGLAGAQIATGRGAEAISTLQDGIKASNDAPALVAALAGVYERSGRVDDAIALYESLVKRDPDSAVGANNLAVLLATHRTDKASLDRARALAERFATSKTPEFIDTWGWVLYKRGEYAEATRALQKAVERSPKAPEFLYHLAMAQLKSGARDAARTNLGQALKPGVPFAESDEAEKTLRALAN